jgi:D-beta-D-heptose 7-phosphate kinase/D-beta-D-heptose 1-phosphate adenosyltransferase
MFCSPLRGKIIGLPELLQALAHRRAVGDRVVFTNGCFDLLHSGHVTYLEAACLRGDLLVVGLNSDASVRRLKGPGRPLLTEAERATVLAGLQSVDYVSVFDGDTPLALIEAIRPDVLVKGGDWSLETIVGREVVEAAGGRVTTIPFVAGHSTTDIVERIRNQLRQGKMPGTNVSES